MAAELGTGLASQFGASCSSGWAALRALGWGGDAAQLLAAVTTQSPGNRHSRLPAADAQGSQRYLQSRGSRCLALKGTLLPRAVC